LAAGDGLREAGSVIEAGLKHASRARPARSREPAAPADLIFPRPLHTHQPEGAVLCRSWPRGRDTSRSESIERLSSLVAFFFDADFFFGPTEQGRKAILFFSVRKGKIGRTNLPTNHHLYTINIVEKYEDYIVHIWLV
jgi:hypothetical protein